MRFRSLGALGASAGFAALLVTSAFGLAGGQSAKDRTTTQKSHVSAASYIVQLSDDPAAAYEGGVAGYAATAPAKGKKFDSTSNDVKKYAAYLNGKHADVAAAVGADKYYDYDFSFNGFAASMNEQQAAKLATVAGVASVTEDVLHQPTTSTTPTFLGLDRPVTGLWAKAGRPVEGRRGRHHRRRRHGHLARAPELLRPDGLRLPFGLQRQAFAPTARRRPALARHRASPASSSRRTCATNKLIGARYYLERLRPHFGIAKWRLHVGPRPRRPRQPHVVSTAGGNNGVQATGAAALARQDQRHGASRAHRRVQGLLERGRTAAAPAPTASPRSTRRSRTAST